MREATQKLKRSKVINVGKIVQRVFVYKPREMLSFGLVEGRCVRCVQFVWCVHLYFESITEYMKRFCFAS